MKTFLIKTGKAVSTLKQEGLFRGGKRVAKAFWAQFGRVRPGDILFVTNGVGDSARYRAHHQAEELECQGFKCSVTIQDNPFLARYAEKFKIFVFHRTLHTPLVAKLIENIKKRQGVILFETDDLVFDIKYLAHMDYYQKMNALEKKLYENGVGGEILRDPYVKTCVTATEYLAKILKTYGKDVLVSKNKLCKHDLEIAEKFLEKGTGSRDGFLRLAYFSGTKSHDKDFATIEDALAKILEKYPKTKLFLAGPLDISRKFQRYEDRVERFVFAPRDEHFGNIAKVDINLAPLEKDNPFCESKSELKWFEAGILGVPTVAVSNQTFSEAIEDGADGFLAGTTDEWVAKIEKLIENADLRKKMGQKAREKILRDYTTVNGHNEEYYGYLRNVIARSETTKQSHRS